MSATRTEHDTMGPVQVPVDRLWGAQTQRALENFPPGGEPMPMAVVRSLALVKKAAAQANAELGVLDPALARYIAKAADEVARGDLDDHFPLVVWQSGSGTQTNMNVNEVLANRACQLAGRESGDRAFIHPNDHVNHSQSTNDAFPTAMHMAAALELRNSLLPAAEALGEALMVKARAWRGLAKIGRTHCMDAVPLTLGQEFSGPAAQMDGAMSRLEACLDGLLALPLGGTAVGTGLGAPPGFARAAVARIARHTGLDFRPAGNRFAAMAAHDDIVACSGACRGLAVVLLTLADNVRLLASGPRCGLGELRLPANEPGSSIMPGKVNPTQCESLSMACIQTMGLDAAVAAAGARGCLQLNVYKPLMIHGLLSQMRLLGDGCRHFAERCVVGLEPDRERIAGHVGRSLMLVTALVPALGYDRAAEVAELAFKRGLTLRDACLELGCMEPEAFDALVRPEGMVGPEDTD